MLFDRHQRFLDYRGLWITSWTQRGDKRNINIIISSSSSNNKNHPLYLIIYSRRKFCLSQNSVTTIEWRKFVYVCIVSLLHSPFLLSLLLSPSLPPSHSFFHCVCVCVLVCECVSLYMLRINCKTQNQQMTIVLIWINGEIIVWRLSSAIFLQSI